MLLSPYGRVWILCPATFLFRSRKLNDNSTYKGGQGCRDPRRINATGLRTHAGTTNPVHPARGSAVPVQRNGSFRLARRGRIERGQRRELMLDTVQVKHFFPKPISEEELRRLGAKALPNRWPRTFVLNPEENEPLPRITFFFPPDGIMHVSAECSIPRSLFEHNARLPNQAEVNEGLQCLCDFVEARTGLPFDPETATVSLVHFARDFQLGEPEAFAAIDRLSRIRMKGLNKLVFNDTTIYFHNKSREIRIYPKLQEVNAKGRATPEAIDAARGNLRFEYCLLNKYGIDSHAKRLGLSDSKARNFLTEGVSVSIMSKLLKELDFPNMITNSESNLVILKKHFSGRKAMTLNGFLATVDQYGERFFKDQTHSFKKAAYYRAANDCKKAGVWRTGNSLE